MANKTECFIGIKADDVKIKYEEKEIINDNIVIGLYNKKINKKYSALVSVDLLEGGKENENSRTNKQSMRKLWNNK